jgi:predicted RND superfamily exporter protein
VVLCSLTTTLGYLALTFSDNRAIVSFGTAAAAGEICWLLAAVLVTPAVLEWRSRRRAARAGRDLLSSADG